VVGGCRSGVEAWVLDMWVVAGRGRGLPERGHQGNFGKGGAVGKWVGLAVWWRDVGGVGSSGKGGGRRTGSRQGIGGLRISYQRTGEMGPCLWSASAGAVGGF